MRKLYPIVIACLFAVGCAAQTPIPLPTLTGTPPKSGKIRYAHIFNLNARFVPTFIALDDMQAQGYSIERIPMTSSALIVAALARGDADIGSLDPQTMWTAIAKGSKVRSIMSGLGSPNFIIVKTGITSCRELNGARFAVPARTGLFPALFEIYVKRNCPNAQFDWLIISDTNSRVAALVAGQIDFAQLPTDYVIELERKEPGKFSRLMDFSKEFPNLLTSVMNVRPDWAKENASMLNDFLKALLLAHRRVNANPKLLYDELVGRFSLDAATAKENGDAWLKLGVWDDNGGFTRESIQYTMDFLEGINTVPAGLKIDDVADLTYLDTALNEIGRK